MTPAETAFLARMRRRVAIVGPEIARRELAAYEVIRRSLSHAELARAISTGQIEQLIAELLSDERVDPVLQSLRLAVDQALLNAARSEAASLPTRIKTTAFDILNPRVIDAARSLDISATGALKAEMRETVRQTVVAGLEAGRNPRTIANRMIEAIGLAPRQELYVRNFRAELEAGDRRALDRALRRGVLETEAGKKISRASHAGGLGLSDRDIAMLDRVLGEKELRPDQIDRMVGAYRKRLIAWNAESHARTTALQAMKTGQRLSWEDAIDRGVVTRSSLRRRWLTVEDSRVRPEHEAMHGEVVGFDERFSNGQLEPGEDEYNCRCNARVFIVAESAAA